jgi:hypothetical protein
MLVTSCATFDQRAGFSDVSTAVEARSGKRVVWNLGTELDAHMDQEVRALLQDTLTVDRAIQVALLNNRDLQALYTELGVAQADLVQAGLLRNPVFDGSVRFLLNGGPAKLDLRAALDFPHSTEFSGGTPTPFVISLKLCSLTPIVGHHLQRPSDQRMTHAQHRSPDPRKSDDHHQFPERSHLLSAP